MNFDTYKNKYNYANEVWSRYPKMLGDIGEHIDDIVYMLFDGKDLSNIHPKYVQIYKEIAKAMEYIYINGEASRLDNSIKIMYILLNNDVDKFIQAYDTMLQYFITHDKYDAINTIVDHGIIVPVDCHKISITTDDYTKLIKETQKLMKKVYIHKMQEPNSSFVARLILNKGFIVGKESFESSMLFRDCYKNLVDNPLLFFYDKEFIASITDYVIHYIENNKYSRKAFRRLLSFLFAQYLDKDSKVYTYIIKNKYNRLYAQLVQYALRTEDLRELKYLCREDNEKAIFSLSADKRIVSRLEYLKAREMLKDIAAV